MRQILFKAKVAEKLMYEKFKDTHKNVGTWVQGFYVPGEENSHFIIPNLFIANGYRLGDVPLGEGGFQIIPETLCQFTGLYDKEGNMVWEGDIVEDKASYPMSYVHILGQQQRGVCRYDINLGGWYFGEKETCQAITSGKYIVIGNRFDNPELLTDKKQ